MNKTTQKFFWISVPIFLSTGVGVGGYYYKKYDDSLSSQTRYLDYDTRPRYAFVDSQALSGKKNVQVLLDGNKIDSLSSVTVTVYNNTDKNYKEVPVYVEITSPDGKKIDLVYQNVSRIGENVTEEKAGDPQRPGGLRFGYNVKIANRIDKAAGDPSDVKPIFQAEYVVLGRMAPKADVDVNFEGLKVKEGRFYASTPDGWFEDLLFFLVFFLIGGVASAAPAVIVMFLIGRRIYEKRLTKIRVYVAEKLAEKLKALGDKPDPNAVAAAVSRTIEEFNWEEIPRWQRMLMRLNPPS